MSTAAPRPPRRALRLRRERRVRDVEHAALVAAGNLAANVAEASAPHAHHRPGAAVRREADRLERLLEQAVDVELDLTAPAPFVALVHTLQVPDR